MGKIYHKKVALPMCGALLIFAKQVCGVQNPIHFYTKCGSANNLDILHCCTELINTYTMECGKVVVTPGYPFGLNLIVGKYQ